ncbi:Putative regulatory protein, GntR-family [Sodalis praecaptivus]|uniref:Putative regulatory protein, GntR-family n=1 Tax=Sodalis praecaptivus TaxID=1239307 RepID=W0HYE5_9GAMM|nr:GntR family transcriptional regulator [Sodalis praecaptivus]AHF77235.1 Putative regulatory protein, GntR-family [Sodalis praecaptivus]
MEPLGLPLYLRIKNIILERIIAFSYVEKLPGELVLAGEFNVARGTVKQAIDALVQTGILFREQGRGTFINRDILQHYYSNLPDLLLRFTGSAPVALEIESLMPTMADGDIGVKMGLAIGSQLQRLERYVKQDGRVVGHGVTWLDGSAYSGLSHIEEGRSLYAQLCESYGFSPVKACDSVVPALCSARLARILSLPEGSPLLRLERRAANAEGAILEYSQFHLADAELSLTIDARQITSDGRWQCTVAP